MDSVKNILMVDDHNLIIEGYYNILQKFETLNFQFNTANDCGSVVKLLNKKHIDLILLDISLPGMKDLGIHSGEDLGVYIRKNYPDISIIIITMLSENLRLYSLLKTINPEGFLLKSDVTAAELKSAVRQVFEGKIYYGQAINNLLRNHLLLDIEIDSIDRSILYYLSIGVKTKNLKEHVPLSKPAIEKRKKLIKEKFEISKSSDLELIIKAKNLGYI